MWYCGTHSHDWLCLQLTSNFVVNLKENFLWLLILKDLHKKFFCWEKRKEDISAKQVCIYFLWVTNFETRHGWGSAPAALPNWLVPNPTIKFEAVFNGEVTELHSNYKKLMQISWFQAYFLAVSLPVTSCDCECDMTTIIIINNKINEIFHSLIRYGNKIFQWIGQTPKSLLQFGKTWNEIGI